MIRIRLIPYTSLRRSWARWINTRRGPLFTCCGVLMYRSTDRDTHHPSH